MTNLNEAVVVLKALGRETKAADAIRVYVDSVQENSPFWDLSNNVFDRSITDSDVREAINRKFAQTLTPPNPLEILKRIAETSGWHPNDVSCLATLTDIDFIRIFKSAVGSDLHKIIEAGLVFRNIASPDRNMLKVTATVESALKSIAAETPINRLRVKRHGINI